MATTRDALFDRVLAALREIWRGGRGEYAHRQLALETLHELTLTAAGTNVAAEELTSVMAALRQLPTEDRLRKPQVEQVATRLKAIQPLLGSGSQRVETGKLNSALGERRAGRPAPVKAPRTPSVLRPLPPDAAATELPSVGPKVSGLLETLVHGTAKGQHTVTVEEILRIAPRRYVDYSNLVSIGSLLNPDGDVTVRGKVIEIRTQHGRAKPFTTIRLSDGTGILRLVFFNTWIAKQLVESDEIYVSGTIQRGFDGGPEMATPEWERVGQRSLTTNRIAPVYPLTKGLHQKTMRTLTRSALDATKSTLVDWLTDAQPFLPADLSLVTTADAYEYLHYPADFDQVAAAKRRLQFENLFLLQLGLVHRKQQVQAGVAQAFPVDQAALDAFIARGLPFTLTGAQRVAIGDVVADVSRPIPMTRLLQGDVGSGKTAVAATIALLAARAGLQTALMAPTELLAEQHLTSLNGLFAGLEEDARPRIALLTGSTKAKARREIDASLQAGEIDILVGTHALVQETVVFHNLALVILDEQHRFGVRQRAMLVEKGRGFQPHVLSMTATPIPRTLNLVLSGDLDVSVMNERPAGRIPIQTRVYRETQRGEAERLVSEEIARGHQVFVICPLVEESENLEAKAAVDEAQRLQEEVFPDLRVDVVHGKMPSRKKDSVMSAFRDRQFDILVSTSVIEVGIDIPNATVMMIEGAERFGLAQLHQLRGRVGRGGSQSYCLLLADQVTADGEERLRTMEATDDGFLLAEKDLELRGPGDFMGTRQSGLPELGWLNDGLDTRLLAAARSSAERLIATEPDIGIDRFPRLKPRLQQFWATASMIDASKS
jgi:ATP-dependent DNA helicase RecG